MSSLHNQFLYSSNFKFINSRHNNHLKYRQNKLNLLISTDVEIIIYHSNQSSCLFLLNPIVCFVHSLKQLLQISLHFTVTDTSLAAQRRVELSSVSSRSSSEAKEAGQVALCPTYQTTFDQTFVTYKSSFLPVTQKNARLNDARPSQ